MLLLAIDTSGKNGGVALVRGDTGNFHLIATAAIAGGSYSARLMPEIAHLLAKSKLDKPEVEGITVATGPGSFTGLRVGIATAKALAEALQKPIAAVSVLEAIAAAGLQQRPVRDGGRVVALQDAGRGETYAGVFIYRAGKLHRQDELLFKNSELLLGLQQAGGELIIAAEPVAGGEMTQAGLNVVSISSPGVDWIARLGVQKLSAGIVSDVSQLDANYVRRSDAELYSLPKLQN
jgi:tRNA threonylcarbamoyladenosine biosynthesis protein TsaB